MPPAFAQAPALTTVKDTVYKSDGTLASGTVVVTWDSFLSQDLRPVFGGNKIVTLANGTLAVALAPNAGAAPVGTSYAVRYYQSGAVFAEEFWVVPSSSPVPAPGAPTSVTQAGTPGSATHCYWISATNANGETLIGPVTCTTTGNATLSGTNYNVVTWSSVSGATGYKVYRTNSSTAPTGTCAGGAYPACGLVGSTALTTINDQSNNTSSATIPPVNTTDPKTLQQVRVALPPTPGFSILPQQVSGGTANRCARFDSLGVLAAHSSDCGAGGGGHTIQEEGTSLAARAGLNFVSSGITASDDVANNQTDVALDTDLNALADVSLTGLLARTSAGVAAARNITGTASNITVTNGDGVSGNPTLDLGSTAVQTDQANTWSTGAQDFSAVTLELPNGATPTGTDCDAAGEAGRIFIDTDATSGQRVYVCEGAGGWVLQGDGGGGGGDSMEVEDGDNAGTFTAIATTGRFEDSGDINFVNTANDISGVVRADAVALTTDTTGNYLASSSNGIGIAGASATAEGGTITPALDFSDAGADPALGAGGARFSNEGVSAAGLVFEGDTDDAFETRVRVTDPTVADRIVTIPNADSTTVQPDAGAANNFLTAVSAAGVISKAQPDFTNLSGAATDAQIPNTITIDLATSASDLTCTNCIGAAEIADLTLGTDTAGNYMADSAAGVGIAVTHTPAEGSTATVALTFADAGADPALGAGGATFSNEGASAAGLVFEGDTDDAFETRMRITDPTAERIVTIPNADSNTVQPLTCSGTDKVSAVSSAGVITCTADQGGAGGDSMEVEDGDNAGTFTAIATTGRFEDSGDINFVNTANDISGLVRADAVALTTDTTGNYVATVSSGLGLTGSGSTEGSTPTISPDFAQTLAGNPALNLGETIFSDDCTSGGFLTEGSTANTNEQLHCFVAGDGVDTTSEITENAATQTLTNKTIAAADNVVTADDTICTDCLGPTEIADLTLGTDTAGNFIQSLTSGVGLTGFPAAGEQATGTPALDFSDAGADPALGAGGARFSNEGASAAGLVFEGDTDDANELRMRITDPTAERVLTIPNADSVTAQAYTCSSQFARALSGTTGATTCESIADADIPAAITRDSEWPSATATLTNKTIDGEGTGNVLTITAKIEFQAAGCDASTAASAFDQPTSNAGAEACYGTSPHRFGAVDYADGASALTSNARYLLPSDWTSTGGVDIQYIWHSGSTSTNSVVWTVQTICVANAEDILAPTYNTAQTVSDANNATASTRNSASITGITMTGCAAGAELFLKIGRDPTNGSDTLAATAALHSIELTIRRQI